MKNFEIVVTKKNGESTLYKNIWKIESKVGHIKLFDSDGNKYSIYKKDIISFKTFYNE